MKMNDVVNDSINCIEEIESIGIVIMNKNELMKRLAEIHYWQPGLVTLIKYGERIRIKLEAPASSFNQINSILIRYGIEAGIAQECSKKICSIK